VRPQDHSKRRLTVSGWPVQVVSYKLDATYYCTVDNVSPGAWISRAQGETREEAESKALEKAAEYLSRTRTFSAA